MFCFFGYIYPTTTIAQNYANGGRTGGGGGGLQFGNRTHSAVSEKPSNKDCLTQIYDETQIKACAAALGQLQLCGKDEEQE